MVAWNAAAICRRFPAPLVFCPERRKHGLAALWLRKEFPKSLFSQPRMEPDTTPPAEKPVPGSAALGQTRGIHAVSSVIGNVTAESRPRRARSNLTSDPAAQFPTAGATTPARRFAE
jgi:hypothetical protein